MRSYAKIKARPFGAALRYYTEPVPIEQLYKALTPQEHVLLRPDMYIGSKRLNAVRTWIVEDRSKLDVQTCKEVEIVPGFVKIFDEMLVNVADNYHRTKKTERATTRLVVDIDEQEGTIRLHNNGRCVDVEWHKDCKAYCPELVFGHFQAGSNFDDNGVRVTGGRNGIGAKATNALSDRFTVEIGDAQRGRLYRQEWRDSMQTRSTPQIQESFRGEEYTQIEFKPKYNFFGLEGLDPAHLSLFARRISDIAACCEGLEVVLNGSVVPIKGFQDYVHLKYTADPEQEEDPSVETQAEEGHEVHFTRLLDKRHGLPWDLAVGTRKCEHLSFVNSINTLNGGTHVQAIGNKIVEALLAEVQRRAGGAVTEALARNALKHGMCFFVNCQISNPEFDGQTKEKLIYPSVSDLEGILEVPNHFLKTISSSKKIVEPIIAAWRERLMINAAKEAKKRAKKVTIDKLEDANLAGTPDHAKKCTLILTEGDSAKSLAVAGLSEVGRDLWGVLPLKGKVMNVRKMGSARVDANQLLSQVQKVLGLDKTKTYKTEKEVATLRYGSIALMCDQDPDGAHIKGLLLSWLSTYWKDLMAKGIVIDGKKTPFVKQIVTPLVKAFPKQKKSSLGEQWFFSMAEFKAFTDKCDEDGTGGNWRFKYYKGLGTSTSKEGKEYFREFGNRSRPLLIDFNPFTRPDFESILLAFDDNRVADRRGWLAEANRQEALDTSSGGVSAQDFCNTDLAGYFQYSNERALPSCIDGLKPSQRKILYTCFEKKLTGTKEMKVAQLGGAVAELTAYHHGEASMHDTIIKLSQNFVGSGNNVPLLEGVGQFGTRLGGGSDHASPRYISTRLSPLARKLFPEEDDSLLEFKSDEGRTIEPTRYVPVIPTLLVNGAAGIGTGYATAVPSYDPLQVAALVWVLLTDRKIRSGLRNKVLERKRLKHLYLLAVEKYQRKLESEVNNLIEAGEGRRRDVTVTVKKDMLDSHFARNVRMARKAHIESARDSLQPWFQDHKVGFCPDGVSEGKMERSKSFTHVTELPIGEWTDVFKAKLDRMITTGLITNYESNCTDVNVDFFIEHKSPPPLKLKRRIPTNLTAFARDNQTIVQFSGPEDVVLEFLPVREELYEKRLKTQINGLQEQIKVVKQGLDFATTFVQEEVKVTDEEDVILAVLAKRGIDKETGIKLLRRTSCHSLTKAKVQEKQAELNELETSIEELRKKCHLELWKEDLLSFIEAYIKHFSLSKSDTCQRLAGAASDLRELLDLAPQPPCMTPATC